MGNLKISELPSASALQGTELFPIVQSGTTSQTTLSDIDNYLIATSLTVAAGETVNLSDATYANLSLLKLTYTAAGGSENMTMNLPDATTNANRLIRFISDTTFTTNTKVNLTAINSQTIDGSTNAYIINKEYEGVQLWSDGTEWFIIQKKG
jgi:hypothetical protein